MIGSTPAAKLADRLDRWTTGTSPGQLDAQSVPRAAYGDWTGAVSSGGLILLLGSYPSSKPSSVSVQFSGRRVRRDVEMPRACGVRARGKQTALDVARRSSFQQGRTATCLRPLEFRSNRVGVRATQATLSPRPQQLTK
jgi:hypothetical protein